MIAHPDILANIAAKQGIKVPEKAHKIFDIDVDQTIKNKYPHFYVFCALQLFRKMSNWDQPHHNAKVIASLKTEDLMKMTVDDYVRAGVDLT